MKIVELDERVNITITKAELVEFARTIIKSVKETDRSQRAFPEYMNVKEIATYLNCSEATIHKRVANREIPHFKKGRLYFKKSVIDDWMDNGQRKSIDHY